MINFRYHVVSLTAVFLALAIGLVVGTAAGNGPAVDSLSAQVDNIHEQNQQLRDQVDELNSEVDKQEEGWTAAAPILLSNRLANRQILVVAMDSSTEYVDRVVQLLTMAGASVNSWVLVSDTFVDPANNDQLLDLALDAAPPAISGALPSQSDGVETSTALLAAVMVGTGSAEDIQTVLAAYESQGFLTVSGESVAAAEGVVFLAGSPYTDDDSEDRNDAVLTMAKRFDLAGKIVVTTPSASGDGNVVKSIRDDPDLVKTASTVDNVSTELGRLSSILALVEQLDGGAGHYGVGSGATATLPELSGS